MVICKLFYWPCSFLILFLVLILSSVRLSFPIPRSSCLQINTIVHMIVIQSSRSAYRTSVFDSANDAPIAANSFQSARLRSHLLHLPEDDKPRLRKLFSKNMARQLEVAPDLPVAMGSSFSAIADDIVLDHIFPLHFSSGTWTVLVVSAGPPPYSHGCSGSLFPCLPLYSVRIVCYCQYLAILLLPFDLYLLGSTVFVVPGG